MNEKFVEVDSNRIRYIESGDSQNVLVLIHGLGASAERWEKVLPFFNKNFRVIIPDLIGFGLSDKPVIDYTVDFFVSFLEKFLKSLNIKSTYLIGSSLGGQICAEFTASHPNFIKKLVLVSPSGMMKQSTPALDAYIMAAMYPNFLNAKNAFEMMESSGDEADENIINGFIERMKLPNAKLAFMSTILGLKNAQIISRKLEQIHTETMLIWGTNDPVIPINYSDEFIASIKDCRFFRIDNCGHTPYVQYPEIFAKKVLNFLDVGRQT